MCEAQSSHDSLRDLPEWKDLFRHVQRHHRHHAHVVAPLPLWQRHVGKNVRAALRPAWSRVGNLLELPVPARFVADAALVPSPDSFVTFDDETRAHTVLLHAAHGGGTWVHPHARKLALAHRARRPLAQPIPSHSVAWNGVWRGRAATSYQDLAEIVAGMLGAGAGAV